MKAFFKVLEREYKRLGEQCDVTFNSFSFHLLSFANKVAMIESDDSNDVSPENTSAKGYYQFVDSALITAYNRFDRYAIYNEKIANRVPVVELSKDEQTALFFANLFQQKGSDSFLIKIAKSGDIEAQRQCYYRFHHTLPCRATIRRTESIIN